MVNPIGTVTLFFIIISPLTTYADDFDWSKPLYGSVDKILEINKFRIKDNVNPDSVGLPQNFIIDFKENGSSLVFLQNAQIGMNPLRIF